MAQTSQQKRQKALTSLETRIQLERENRASPQAQAFEFILIPPSDYEFGLMAELNNIKKAMGLSFQDQPNPF